MNTKYHEHKNNPTLVSKKILFIFSTILLLACNSNIKSISADDFYNEIQTNNGKIIDVRTAEEYSNGYIQGATNIDFKSDNFSQSFNDINKDEKIYLYCLKGVRSENAAKKLSGMGFKNVVSLAGGIEAWQTAKLPLIMPERIAESNTPNLALKKYRLTEFDSIIKSKKLVFVDFNATWCGPCKAMQPYVDKIKEERAEEVTVLSIDTDVNPELSKRYSISSIPAIYLFKKGKVLTNIIGGQSEIKLNEFVDKYK